MHLLKGLPHALMAHNPFQPPRDQSLLLVFISPQPCPAWTLILPSSAQLQDDVPAGAGLALSQRRCPMPGAAPIPCPAPGGLGHTLPTHFSPHIAHKLLTSPDFLLVVICGTTAPLCLEDKAYTEPSLSWKKEILNMSLLHTNRCLWCTNSHRRHGGVLGLKEQQELREQYENMNKDEQPR